MLDWLPNYHPLVVHFPIGLLIAAVVVAYLTWLACAIALAFIVPSLGEVGVYVSFGLSVIITLALAVLTFRRIALKERACDICGKPIPNKAVDWKQRIGWD